MKMPTSSNDYRGPLQGVIFDWAGTAVDHGCFGPVAVFQRSFEKFGMEPTIEETRAPMGREKREHVAAMLAMPRLADIWMQQHGREPSEEDIDLIFSHVRETMPKTLADYSEPVPGCADALAALRAQWLKIGSCTGYSRDMMSGLLPAARAAGFDPDCLVTADEAPQGRPLPWMCWLNCMRLGLYPPESVVKVGDTLADIQEGLNAGHWSVGVTRTSNALGLTAAQAAAMDQKELARREEELKKTFLDAGAHFVISSIIDLPPLCEKVSALLTKGQKPSMLG